MLRVVTSCLLCKHSDLWRFEVQQSTTSSDLHPHSPVVCVGLRSESRSTVAALLLLLRGLFWSFPPQPAGGSHAPRLHSWFGPNFAQVFCYYVGLRPFQRGQSGSSWPRQDSFPPLRLRLRLRLGRRLVARHTVVPLALCTWCSLGSLLFWKMHS